MLRVTKPASAANRPKLGRSISRAEAHHNQGSQTATFMCGHIAHDVTKPPKVKITADTAAPAGPTRATPRASAYIPSAATSMLSHTRTTRNALSGHRKYNQLAG